MGNKEKLAIESARKMLEEIDTVLSTGKGKRKLLEIQLEDVHDLKKVLKHIISGNFEQEVCLHTHIRDLLPGNILRLIGW